MKGYKKVGAGDNCRYDESARNGQTIRTESSPDKSSHKLDKMETLGNYAYGSDIGGGPQDTSHSLSSAGETPAVPKARGGRRSHTHKGKVKDNNYMRGGSY
jgi:hypothetical protein